MIDFWALDLMPVEDDDGVPKPPAPTRWRVWKGARQVIIEHPDRLEAARRGELALGVPSCTAEIEPYFGSADPGDT